MRTTIRGILTVTYHVSDMGHNAYRTAIKASTKKSKESESKNRSRLQKGKICTKNDRSTVV